LENGETAPIRPHHIEKNHITGMLAYQLDCLLTTIRSHGRKPSAFKASAEAVTTGFIIINDE
jgi:hypothetical protein